MKILLTGSNGFVGAALSKSLVASHFRLVAPTRVGSVSENNEKHAKLTSNIGEINAATDWEKFLKGVDTIIHCAAISEMGKNPDAKQLLALRTVNVDGTLNLARQAASLGVKRFIFLSSIKVNGDSTRLNSPFTHDVKVCPTDAYGISKLDAEKGLQNIALEMGMEFVILRLPLVYGPGVKGNFKMLMRLVECGIPMPLSNIKNRRSFLGIDNLVDLVINCISHPKAANQILLASDDDDISTTELLQGIAQAMGKPSRLFPCPPVALVAAAKFVGKSDAVEKLLRSLQIDISETKYLLDWAPPVSIRNGLKRCFPKL